MSRTDAATKKKAYGQKSGVMFFGTLLFAFLFHQYFFCYPRTTIPSHLLHHPAVWIEDFLTPQTAKDLNSLVKEMAVFPTVVADLKSLGFKPRHEHIGEAEALQADGSCKEKFMLPDTNRVKCIIPQRIDVGRHFILTGGADALRESYQKMVARLGSFAVFMYDKLDDYDIIKGLFNSKNFQEAAKSICPLDKQVLDPFQFNFIIQVPGQTVATHIDSPFFWGASRKQFPQWLLVVMTFSNLFADKFIDQVQVVAYLHEWEPAKSTNNNTDSGSNSGTFIYYNSNDKEPSVMLPKPRSAAIIDGSKTLHAAMVYKADVDPPMFKGGKDTYTELHYLGDEQWAIVEDGKTRYTYGTEDLRISVVYRARCFATEETRDLYNSMSDDDQMELETILDTLKEDLVRRKKYTRAQLDTMRRYDLAVAMLDEYVQYPLPSARQALFPFNWAYYVL